MFSRFDRLHSWKILSYERCVTVNLLCANVNNTITNAPLINYFPKTDTFLKRYIDNGPIYVKKNRLIPLCSFGVWIPYTRRELGKVENPSLMAIDINFSCCFVLLSHSCSRRHLFLVELPPLYVSLDASYRFRADGFLHTHVIAKCT